MKVIVPMAGVGKRLRPHTLTVPKPLIPIAGKPIVHRLVEDIADVCQEQIEEVAFVIGDFGKAVETKLIQVAESIGARGSIYYQEEALGTAHAVWCAEKALDGKVVVAFADTLFRADFRLNASEDGILWVKQVEDPSAFGVVKLDRDGYITDFVEKPKEPVSDLAMIGIYYFRNGAALKEEIKYLIDNKGMRGGEYQLPDAMARMKDKGARFAPGKVDEWLDCGNKEVTVDTNARYLEFVKEKKLIDPSAEIKDSVVIQPSFIGEGAKISNSIVGPHVSIGKGCTVEHSVIRRSLIQENVVIKNGNLVNSMIGNYALYDNKPADVSLGDYSVYG